MKLPFGQKDDNEASYTKYTQFRKEVETVIETIQKMPDRKERLAAYQTVSDKLHALYGDKPQLINSKTAGLAAGGGAIVGVGATAAAAGSILFATITLPVLITFGAIATATGALAGGGIGGVVGNFKELRKQRKEHGSVDNAREIHRIIGLVDAEIQKEKSSLSTQERDELLTKQAAGAFNNVANQNKPQQPAAVTPAPKAEAPVASAPKTEVAAPKAETPAEKVAPPAAEVTPPVAEATPVAEVKAVEQKPKRNYDKITSFNKKGPKQ